MKKYLEFPAFLKAVVVFALFMLLQELADLALQAGSAVLGCMALVGIRRKCGPRPGGNKRLYLCPVENFQDVEFPTYAMATAGEITVPIPVVTGKKFIEIQATYDSTKWGFSSKGKTGNQSFEQNISFEVSRLDKESIALASRLLNNPVVIIAVSNTGIPFFIGSTEVPLELEIGGDSGAKGTDPTKMTFTCKNDGYMFPAIPLADTALFAIEALPAVTE